jgi:aquaporin Z
MLTRQKVGVILAEFIGTFILATVFIAAAGYFNFTAPWYVSIAAGSGYAVLAALFYAISGAHFNPAVTIGAWTLRKISAITAAIYVAMQFFGGLLALAFVEYVRGIDIIAQGAGSIDGRVFVSELVGAAVFGMGVAYVLMQKKPMQEAPLILGASLIIGILIASVAGPGYINPAVSLANNTWDYTVVVAPVIGVVLGMNTYSLFFASEKHLLNYESSKKLKLTTRRRKQ